MPRILNGEKTVFPINGVRKTGYSHKSVLVCCSPWVHKELDMTGWLNNNNVRMKLDPKLTPQQINLSQIDDLNEDQKP